MGAGSLGACLPPAQLFLKPLIKVPPLAGADHGGVALTRRGSGACMRAQTRTEPHTNTHACERHCKRSKSHYITHHSKRRGSEKKMQVTKYRGLFWL